MKPVNRILLLVTILTIGACNDPSSAQPPADAGSATGDAAAEATAQPQETATGEIAEAGDQPDRLSFSDIEAELGLNVVTEPWVGDLDTMVERRVIRVLTVYGLARYYLDGPRERGITYDFFKLFEDFLNKRLNRGHMRVHVLFIPVARDQLISGLLEGRGDIAAAGLTITPERDEVIDFTQPVTRELSEVLVTGPAAPAVESLEELAGQRIYVRASSSYRQSLDLLNSQFVQKGLQPIEIELASELLEDEDILEMVNAGLVKWAVVDDYKADIWAGVFKNLTPRKDLVFRSGGRLGYAFRENSPKLAAELNEFLKSHRQGTLQGNILIKKYIDEFDWAKNALAAKDYDRFQGVIGIFQDYGEQYGFDFLMVAAQGYQESRLDQSARSRAGAVGIMQLLPSTAADPNVGIPDISEAEPNIHAGIKYLNFIRERYFNDPAIDFVNQTFFALAAYNAGPARVRKLRQKAEQQGYDPNRWFDNVEVIAAKEIGRETVQYVANIYKYYIAYRLSTLQQVQRMDERKRQGVD
jgi:membrane-bound lytic murein transglycosylase MltF